MAYLPPGGLSELVQLRPRFLHILGTRALTECDLIIVINRNPPVAVLADPFENRVIEPAKPDGGMGLSQGTRPGAHGRERKGVGEGRSGSVRGASGGGRTIKKKKKR